MNSSNIEYSSNIHRRQDSSTSQQPKHTQEDTRINNKRNNAYNHKAETKYIKDVFRQTSTNNHNTEHCSARQLHLTTNIDKHLDIKI